MATAKTSAEERVGRLERTIRRLRKQNRRLREENRELRKHVSRDPLTGLWNRIGFSDLLVRDILSAMRRKKSRRVAILYLDVDNFKSFNSRFGHSLGDGVLRSVARNLAAQARATDIVARFGGDEFVIAFLDATPRQLLLKFRRKNGAGACIPAFVLRSERGEVKITLSGGIAAYRRLPPLKGECRADTIRRCIEAAIANADRALYSAKKSGRNRICARGLTVLF